MNSKKKRSSRNRMESRLKRKSKPSPVVLRTPDGKAEFDANRAARKQRSYFLTHIAGLSIRQEQNDKRKENRKAANRVLRKMRKETKAAMRAAG